MNLRERLSNATSNLSSKIRSDARTAERGAYRARDEFKRRARQDVRTAGRRARNVSSSDVRSALRSAGSQLEGVEAQAIGDGDRSQETFARAEDNAMMGAPMDVGLNPTTSPEDVQNLVTGGAGTANQRSEPQGFDWGMGSVDQMASETTQDPGFEHEFSSFGDETSTDGDSPLEFDSFGDGDSALELGDERWY